MKRAELEKLTSELGQLFEEARETLIKLTCIDKMRYEVGKMNSVGITCCFNDIIYYILYIIFIIFGKVSKMISQGLTKNMTFSWIVFNVFIYSDEYHVNSARSTSVDN